MRYSYIFDGILYYPYNDSITYVRQFYYTCVIFRIEIIKDMRSIPVKSDWYEV